MTSPVHGCSTQSGFNALHALLLGVIFVIFDMFVFFKNAYCCLQVLLSSDTILIHAYPLACFLCLPETLCIFWITLLPLAIVIKTSLMGYPALRNCLLSIANAVFQILSHCDTYLS